MPNTIIAIAKLIIFLINLALYHRHLPPPTPCHLPPQSIQNPRPREASKIENRKSKIGAHVHPTQPCDKCGAYHIKLYHPRSAGSRSITYHPN